MLKKIVEYSSLIGFTAFILNFTYLTGFYSSFNIDIFIYEDIVDIIFSLSNAVFSMLVVIMIALPFSVFFPTKDIRISPFSNDILKISIFLMFIGVILLILVFTSSNSTPGKWEMALLAYFISVAPFIYIIMHLCLKKWVLSSKYPNRLYLILVGIAFELFALFLGLTEANWMRENKFLTPKVAFLYHNKTISTDSASILIGETKQAIFFYNLKTKSSTIYRRENVDSIVIRK